jgi:hypothetical protein
MTAEEFVRVAKLQACDGAIDATISSLGSDGDKGSSPTEREDSTWYRSLNAEHRSIVNDLIAETAHQAVFSFLALVDGVASLGDGKLPGRLELFYKTGDQRSLLNDGRKEELHNLFNELTSRASDVPPKGSLVAYEVGPAEALLSRSMPGDGLEIHHVPKKSVGMAAVSGYRSELAPAIALPKREHRRMPSS